MEDYEDNEGLDGFVGPVYLGEKGRAIVDENFVGPISTSSPYFEEDFTAIYGLSPYTTEAVTQTAPLFSSAGSVPDAKEAKEIGEKYRSFLRGAKRVTATAGHISRDNFYDGGRDVRPTTTKPKKAKINPLLILGGVFVVWNLWGKK